jgi:hypothetical protein
MHHLGWATYFVLQRVLLEGLALRCEGDDVVGRDARFLRDAGFEIVKTRHAKHY